MKEIKVGICGWGNVATGLYKAVNANKKIIERNTNLDIKINFIGARRDNPNCDPQGALVLRDIFDVVSQDIDVVIELIGGVETARELILSAINNKKHVITANKAVIFNHGDELFKAARDNNVKILFEAAVCAGTPIIKVLQEELAGNNISKISGMLNGTTNFILAEMEKGEDFEPTLKIAQEKGYAEPDPSFDIEGIDAAHKIGILSHIAHGTPLPPKEFYIEGITQITGDDFQHAKELGYVIKHLAVAKQDFNAVELRAHPAFIKNTSILSSLQGVRNGIEIDTDLIGKIHITGSGAGQESTASGLISDIIHLAGSNKDRAEEISNSFNEIEIAEFSQIPFQHYFYLEVDDNPGMMALITSLVAGHNIGIETIIQKDELADNLVPLFFITDLCEELKAKEILNKFKNTDVIKKVKRIRVEAD